MLKYKVRRKALLGLEDGVPTQEEYIAQQIAAKKAAALDKSRNRTSVRVPKVPNQETEEEWRNRINNYIKYEEEILSRMMAEYNNSSKTFDRNIVQKEQALLDKLLEEKDKGYPKLVLGSNCMYNAGDCYGLNIPGNQTFAAKHKELGFKRVDSSNMEPGDIVQVLKYNKTPVHAMIFDSKDKNSKPLYNYAIGSHSGDFNEDYVKQGRYPMEYNPLVYRYVGTPADSTQWINEYKQKYGNGMRCGGRRKAEFGLDVQYGGRAIPIGRNMVYFDGNSHENGGIGVGNKLEVEGGEVGEYKDNTLRVFSSVPFLQGFSPAQLVMGGANPNKVFKAQENFKDVNRINDDGTTYQNGGQTKSNSVIRTEADKKVPARNRAIYSAVDATSDYPKWWQAIGLGIGSNFKTIINPDSMNYTVTDSVADAAWRKRLGLNYDDKFLIPNKDGSVRLPRNVEMEIPTDTTMLKKRIADNEKFANQSNIVGEDWQIVQAMMKKDKEALEALRKTYKTGEPVVVNEYAHNNRKLSKNGELIDDAINYKSPLNVMRNYTIQYDPKNRKMNYWDTYDFNEFEWGVPGKPFEIKGSIPLKRYGGSSEDDTKTAALKRLRNKFTIRGNYNDGMFGGAGAGSIIMERPEFITDTITKRYLVPVTQNFNDAFGDAVDAGLNKFMFNNKWYNTKKGNNPNNNAAGAARTQTVIIPVEHKEVRRRKKELGGDETIGEIKTNYFTGIGKFLNPIVDKFANNYAKDVFGDLPINEIRKRLYNNLTPARYSSPLRRIEDAVKHNKPDGLDEDWARKYRDDIFATYLDIPVNDRHKNATDYRVIDSNYKPTKGNNNKEYKTVNYLKDIYDSRLIKAADNIPIGKNRNSILLNGFFGEHTVGKGVDKNKGQYVSFYDKWDIAPFLDKEDETLGIGKPIEFYDRIYFDDYYKVNSAPNKGDYYGGYLPEIEVKAKSKKKQFGGSMIYTINGNVKNGLMSVRPKAQYGTEKKINANTKIGEDGLIYTKAIDGDWYTDGTRYEDSKYYMGKKSAQAYSREKFKRQAKPQSLDEVVVTGTRPKVKEESKPITTSSNNGNTITTQTIEGKQVDYPKTKTGYKSFTYKKDKDGKLVKVYDEDKRYDNSYIRPNREGANYKPNKYNPLTGETVDEQGIVETSEPSITGTTKVSSSTSLTPRGRGTKSDGTFRGTAKVESSKPATAINPMEARYASRVQKGQAQEVTPKPVVEYNEATDKNPDKYRYTRAAGFKAGTSPSSTGGETQSKDGNWVPQYNLITGRDWLGVGTNLVGHIASYFANRDILDRYPMPTKPVMAPAVKLKRRVNINPDLTNSKEAELMGIEATNRNTSSSNTTLARNQRIMNESRDARNKLYAYKENAETQLINQDNLNRQGVYARNVAAYNDWLNKTYVAKTNKLLAKQQVLMNLINGIPMAVNNVLGNIETRKSTNDMIRAIAAANPNVDGRLLGIGDYYTQKLANGKIAKYNKNHKFIKYV